MSTDWKDQGSCVGIDPDLWFPERGEDSNRAKAICAGCQVRMECLEYAIENCERFGIWGGLSERQRRRLRASNAYVRGPHAARAACGTNAGYIRHRRRKEAACEACRAAHSEYQRSLAARRKAEAA